MAMELRRSTQLMTWNDRRDIRAIHAEAVKAAARVNALGYVTYTAMTQAGALTSLESELSGRAPLAEGRFRMLVDSFALAAAQEIQELRWRA